MSADESDLLTREDVLDGLFAGHTRAGGACLLAIESRTAHLVARSRQAMERFLTEVAAEEREIAFLEALAPARQRRRQDKSVHRCGTILCAGGYLSPGEREEQRR